MLQILLFSFPFQLTPSRRATKSGSVLVLQWEFQLTPSRRATSGFFSVALIVFNFNSRPHGGRRGRSEMPYDNAAFQLTPSRRATLSGRSQFPISPSFQLTPSRRATMQAGKILNMFKISTHALTEGDQNGSYFIRHDKISTHALTEGDFPAARLQAGRMSFQLTPSRRATKLAICFILLTKHFNSRPHGGRPLQACYYHKITFQLTPSRRATAHFLSSLRLFSFQLTPSRRATMTGWIRRNTTRFQLTPSRRATGRLHGDDRNCRYFNSRPHGGRHVIGQK